MDQKQLQKQEEAMLRGPIPQDYQEARIVPADRYVAAYDADFQIIEEYRAKRDAPPPSYQYDQPEIRPGAVAFSLFGWACVFAIAIVAGYGIFQAAIGLLAGVLSVAETVGRYVAMAGGIAMMLLMLLTVAGSVRDERAKKASQSDTVIINQTVNYNTQKNG